MNDAVKKEQVDLVPKPGESLESTVSQTPNKADEISEPEETSQDMWSDLDAQLDDADEALANEAVGEAPQEPTVTPKAEEKPEDKPKEEVKAKEDKPAEIPEEETPTPSAKEEVKPEQESMEQVRTPEEIQAEFDENRRVAMEKMEEHFQMSDEDADLMLTDPQKIIPKLGARLFMDIYESVMRSVHISVPGMIQQTQQMTSAQKQAEGAFYDKWPALKDAKYEKTVNQLGMAYRQANPQASTEEFIANVGASAMIALQIPLGDMGEKVQLPAGAKEVVDEIPAHRPVQSGGVNSPPGQGKINPFTALDMEFEAEEDD